MPKNLPGSGLDTHLVELGPTTITRGENACNPRADSHMSQVPSHLRSIHTMSMVERMEFGTYHFTRDLRGGLHYGP
jgi:hypothetical protein